MLEELDFLVHKDAEVGHFPVPTVQGIFAFGSSMFQMRQEIAAAAEVLFLCVASTPSSTTWRRGCRHVQKPNRCAALLPAACGHNDTVFFADFYLDTTRAKQVRARFALPMAWKHADVRPRDLPLGWIVFIGRAYLG